MDGRGRGIGSRLVVVLLTLTLTACASRAPISMEQGATPEPSRTQATITCVSKYTLTTVLAPFIAADALLLAVMTPVAILVDKERTVQAWHEVGLFRPQCD